jgi:hypothetical protein
MKNEAMLLAKLQHLPPAERVRLLRQIEEWIEQRTQPADVQQAVAIVESTWASLLLDHATLRWVAEDKELEYDFDRLSRRR